MYVEPVKFSMLSPSNSSAALVLLIPSGVAVGTSVRSNGQATFTLLSTGVYTIRVSAANRRTIGSYNLNLECFFPAPSPDAVALPCGALAAGTTVAGVLKCVHELRARSAEWAAATAPG